MNMEKTHTQALVVGGGDGKSVYNEEDDEDLLTLSQRFQLSKKLKMRLGTKKKGRGGKPVKSLTKPKKLKMGLGTQKRKGLKSLITKIKKQEDYFGTEGVDDEHTIEQTKVGSERLTRTRRCKRKMEKKRKLNDDFEVENCAAMERAAEIQKSLDPEFPSFFKLMLRSHVTQGFWLGLPMEFWRLHLPKCDTTIILEGEDGIEYQTKFLSEKVGLSGGWRGFSLEHKLLEGDVVVFHLVMPCKFKVYVVRANRLAVVDGAQNLDDSASEAHLACNKKVIFEQTNQSQETPGENEQMALNSCLAPETDESANGMEVVTSEDMGNCGISNSIVRFSDFKIIVNDYIINSELSKHLQAKYYDLCYARKSYLHVRLINGINQTLAAGIISETVNISEAIKASKLSTSLDDYAAWDKTLEAFEILGMDVGFLRSRINRLSGLAIGSAEEVDSKRYEEASREKDQVKEEARSLELKLLELNEAIWRLEKEMECMKEKSERYEIMFQEEASAAW